MARKRTVPSCQLCDLHPAAWAAVLPVFVKGTEVVPHRAIVCQRCYIDQYIQRYGKGVLEPPQDLDPEIAAEKGIPPYVAPE